MEWFLIGNRNILNELMKSWLRMNSILMVISAAVEALAVLLLICVLTGIEY
nr:MAG TPA: hypothetical protein [Caudoviricetes sp.]